jgi:hypothetical protein
MLCASARLAAKLNLVDPHTFPLPKSLSAPPLASLLDTVSRYLESGAEPQPQVLFDRALPSRISLPSRRRESTVSTGVSAGFDATYSEAAKVPSSTKQPPERISLAQTVRFPLYFQPIWLVTRPPSSTCVCVSNMPRPGHISCYFMSRMIAWWPFSTCCRDLVELEL